MISPSLHTPGSVAAAMPPGSGTLTVTRRGSRSVVTRAQSSSPLRLLTPSNHGSAAWVFVSTLGGGLVNGDDVTLDAEIDAHGAAVLSTQASTKVYASPDGVRSALGLRVGEAAWLAVLPDPVVCFAHARYRQSIDVDLGPRAELVLVDWITSGRHAAGERWAFEEYRSTLRIWSGSRLVVFDRTRLMAEDALVDQLGRFDALATVLLIGPTLGRHGERLLKEVDIHAVERRARQLVAASPVDGGCVLRIAGRSTEEVGRTIRRWLGLLPAALGDDPWRGKW